MLDLGFVGYVAAAGVRARQWERVRDDLLVAAIPCAQGDLIGEPKSRVRRSDAPESPHHHKLYYLRSSDNRSYVGDDPVETGFAIVKESFHPRPIAGPAVGLRYPRDKVQFDDRWWSVGDPAGLFVMVKVGDVEGSDAGWIYGTISADGHITSAGKVATCARCHEDATHERLFGLPDA